MSSVESQNIMDKILSFKDLRVWQMSINLVEETYGHTNQYPKEEIYGLSAQMRRAAVSVSSNIAEGFKRRSSKEFRHFLNISLGSLAEIETQIIISARLGYIRKQAEGMLLEKTDHIGRMITNLYKRLGEER